MLARVSVVGHRALIRAYPMSYVSYLDQGGGLTDLTVAPASDARC